MFTLFGKPYKQTPPTTNQTTLLIESLYSAGTAGTNKLELQHQNFMGITAKLKVLRDNGAIIVRRIATVVDSNGLTRKRIAHYILCGFLEGPEYDNQHRQRYEKLTGRKYSSSL